MADIELVIKIPEEEYNYVKTQVKFGITNPLKMRIANGAPLPKGHGRLIDETDLKTLFELDDRLWWSNAVEEFADLPTIIEADKESEDEEV